MSASRTAVAPVAARAVEDRRRPATERHREFHRVSWPAPTVTPTLRCACGGGCSRCGDRERGIQPKLEVSQPGDPWEREADRLADQVVRLPAARIPRVSPIGANAQREWGSSARSGGSFPQPEEATRPGDGARAQVTPAALHEVLGSSGTPLDPATRAFMESRFGADFGAVRVHTDGRAAQSAAAVDAHAYTVGRDIAFGARRFRPGTPAGDRLIAHELAHTLQQSRNGTSRLQRACAATACPPVSVPFPAVYPFWRWAEECLQNTYAATHPNSEPGVSLGFNVGWRALTGKDRAEREALTCLRPHFTAKSGTHPGEPDIWDFANRTMYEITTVSGTPFRIGKLRAEIALANKVASTADCGGMTFGIGHWAPPSTCYSLRGDFYLRFLANDTGVLVYSVVKDVKKEATIVSLAAVAAAAKTLGKGAGKKLGGKLIPGYAIASLAAGIVLIVSGKAEAKLGPGGEEPLLQLFEALAKSGTPVPKEIQEMIEANPDLKKRIEAAMVDGDERSAAQKALAEEMLALIAANKDQFTAEELEFLLTATEAAGAASPEALPSVEALRSMISKRGVSGITKEAGKGTGPRPTDPTVPPPAPVEVVPGMSAEARDLIQKASGPERRLWDAMVVESAGDAPKATNEAVRRFFAMLPKGLTDAQVDRVIPNLAGAQGKTLDEVLETVRKGLQQEREAAERAPEPGPEVSKPEPTPETAEAPAPTPTPTPSPQAPAPDPAASLSIEGDPMPKPGASREEVIAKLKAAASKERNYGRVPRGRRGYFWGKEKDGRINAILRGKDSKGVRSAAWITSEVTGRDQRKRTITVRIISATPVVDQHGSIVAGADTLVGRSETIHLFARRGKRR